MAREAFLKCHNQKGLVPGISGHCLTIHLQVERGVLIPIKLLKLWVLNPCGTVRLGNQDMLEKSVLPKEFRLSVSLSFCFRSLILLSTLETFLVN
jgi:hypothetical protein